MPIGKITSDCGDLAIVQESMPIGIDGMNDTERIRRRIRDLMKARGLNVSQLAAAAGVSQSALSRLVGEKRKREAKRPSHGMISKLERFFGEPVSDPSRLPRPDGLEDFLRANRAARKIDDDEADAMRRLGAPPGRTATDDYWSALLLAIRTTEAATKGDGS